MKQTRNRLISLVSTQDNLDIDFMKQWESHSVQLREGKNIQKILGFF